MNVKMIVSDLDRTLLHTDETVSQYTTGVLTRCREAGIKVVYATGRGCRSARGVAPCAYFDGKITQGGAVVAVGADIIETHVNLHFSAQWAVTQIGDEKELGHHPTGYDRIVQRGEQTTKHGEESCRLPLGSNQYVNQCMDRLPSTNQWHREAAR